MIFLMSRLVEGFTNIHHICIDREGDRIKVFYLTTGQKKESATIDTASFINL